MKLPLLTGAEIVKILKKLGFQEIRQRGSHQYPRHQDGRATVVPIHSHDVGRGLLKKILNDADVTREEFLGF